MAIRARQLASGTGWRLQAFTCTSGPRDPVFEERHEAVAMAVTMHGTFQYRTSVGHALLTPGAVLLGNAGHCFECGHAHGVGDRCLSVHLDAESWQDVVSATPGARSDVFGLPALPPLPLLLPYVAGLQAIDATTPAAAAEERVLGFAGAVVVAQQGVASRDGAVSARDERRISVAVRHIEQRLDDPLSLQHLAEATAMSRFHFLRTFSRVVGVTPHRFVQRARLQRAAEQLRRTAAPVADIALAAGFNDLSAFHAGFRRWMGTTPAAYRAGCVGT